MSDPQIGFVQKPLETKAFGIVLDIRIDFQTMFVFVSKSNYYKS